jgi:hypothetical protein
MGRQKKHVVNRYFSTDTGGITSMRFVSSGISRSICLTHAPQIKDAMLTTLPFQTNILGNDQSGHVDW